MPYENDKSVLVATPDTDCYQQLASRFKPPFVVYPTPVQDEKQLALVCQKNQFDTVCLDGLILGDQGVHGIPKVRDWLPDAKLIIFSKTPSHEEEVAAILFGAKAYLPFDYPQALFEKMLSRVAAGEVWVPRDFTGRLLKAIEDIAQPRHTEAQSMEVKLNKLTPRETEIAGWIARGASNRVVADALKISERTVKAHLGVIFRKLDIQDRLQLALFINRHHQLSGIWTFGQQTSDGATPSPSANLDAPKESDPFSASSSPERSKFKPS